MSQRNKPGEIITLTIGYKSIATGAGSWNEAAAFAEAEGFNPKDIQEALRIYAPSAPHISGSSTTAEPDWSEVFEEERMSTLPGLENVSQTVFDERGNKITNPEIIALIEEAKSWGYDASDPKYHGNLNNAVRDYITSGRGKPKEGSDILPTEGRQQTAGSQYVDKVVWNQAAGGNVTVQYEASTNTYKIPDETGAEQIVTEDGLAQFFSDRQENVQTVSGSFLGDRSEIPGTQNLSFTGSSTGDRTGGDWTSAGEEAIGSPQLGGEPQATTLPREPATNPWRNQLGVPGTDESMALLMGLSLSKLLANLNHTWTDGSGTVHVLKDYYPRIEEVIRLKEGEAGSQEERRVIHEWHGRSAPGQGIAKESQRADKMENATQAKLGEKLWFLTPEMADLYDREQEWLVSGQGDVEPSLPIEAGSELAFFLDQQPVFGNFFSDDYQSQQEGTNWSGREGYIRAYVAAKVKDHNAKFANAQIDDTKDEFGSNIAGLKKWMTEANSSYNTQLEAWKASPGQKPADIPKPASLFDPEITGGLAGDTYIKDWSDFPFMGSLLEGLTDQAKASEILASTVVQAIGDLEKMKVSESIATSNNVTQEAIAQLQQDAETERVQINEDLATGVALGELDSRLTLAAQKESAANALALYQLSGQMPAIDEATGMFMTDGKGNILAGGVAVAESLEAQKLELSREELAQDREFRMYEMFGRLLPTETKDGVEVAVPGTETLESQKWGFTKQLQTAEVTGKWITYKPDGTPDLSVPPPDTFEARRWSFEKDMIEHQQTLELAKIDLDLEIANLNASLAQSEQELAASIEAGKLTEAVASRRQKMLLEQETEVRARDQMRLNTLVTLSDPAIMLFAQRYGLIEGFESALGIQFGDDIIDPPPMLPLGAFPTAQELARVTPSERRIMLAEYAVSQEGGGDAALSLIQKQTPGSARITRPSVLEVTR